MNTFFKLTALAGLFAITGHAFAVDDITRVDQIPVLKEETQHATVSERVTSRFTRSHYRQFDLDQAFSAKIFDRYLNLLDYSPITYCWPAMSNSSLNANPKWVMSCAPESWIFSTICTTYRKSAVLSVINTR